MTVIVLLLRVDIEFRIGVLMSVRLYFKDIWYAFCIEHKKCRDENV